MLKLQKNDVFVMAGDSVTDMGRVRPNGEDLPNRNCMGTGYPNFVSAIIYGAYPELNIRCINKGFSGYQSADLLGAMDDVLLHDPTIMSFCIGINDVWRLYDAPAFFEMHESLKNYRANIEGILDRAENVREKIVISPYFLEPNAKDPMRITMDGLVDICGEVAYKRGLPFVNLQKAFEPMLESYHPMFITWDRIHPSQAGAYVIARELLRALGVESL